MIKVGCCGFSEAHYKYFKHFNLVEIQNTFYQPPKITTAVKWRNAAPGSFEFTMKAWQLITHKPTSPTYRRLKTRIPEKLKNRYGFFKPTREVLNAWEKTKQFALNLKATIIVFQCPPNFTPTEENLKNMRQFFTSVDRENFIFAWEPRGNWPKNLVKQLCDELNLIHVVDPFKDETISETIKYYRLHGIKGYNYQYTDEDLLRLIEFCSQGDKIYCLFNNVNMRNDALRFKELLKSKNKSKTTEQQA